MDKDISSFRARPFQDSYVKIIQQAPWILLGRLYHSWD